MRPLQVCAVTLIDGIFVLQYHFILVLGRHIWRMKTCAKALKN